MSEMMKPGEIGIDAQLLAKRLGQMTQGEEVDYAELGKIVGRDVQVEARGALQSARRVVHREQGLVFGVKRGWGLRCLEDAEIIHTAAGTMRHIGKMARRKSRDLAAVKDYAALSDQEKVRHNASLSILAVIDHGVKGKAIQKVEIAVGKERDKLAIAKTLELFK